MFEIREARIRSERTPSNVVTLLIHFLIDGPAGDHPASFTFVWPSGDTVTLDEFMLPFGPCVIDMPMTVGEAGPGYCALRLRIADQDLGEFPFEIE